MSFHTTWNICQSEGLKHRMIAAAAAAGDANPVMWIEQQMYAMVPLMITPPVEGVYQYWWQVWEYAESTMNENNNPDIGARTDVILDSWINSVVVTHRINLGLIPSA